MRWMNTSSFPGTPGEIDRSSWSDLAPQLRSLEQRKLDASSVETFLREWTGVTEIVAETMMQLRIAVAQDTGDEAARDGSRVFMRDVFPAVQGAEQRLKERLLRSGLCPPGFEEPLRHMRAEVGLFRTVNVPLLAEEQELEREYQSITGARTIEWEDEEVPVSQMGAVYQEHDRERRERAWMAVAKRQLADRDKLNDLWERSLRLRLQITKNAEMSSYRAYRWLQLHRFDYLPEDAQRLDSAVEEVVVPALLRRRRLRQEQLGVTSLRPWDTGVDPLGRPPLHPFSTGDDLAEGTSVILRLVDPQFGAYFELMRREGLLDLGARSNKAPGAFAAPLPHRRRRFIFMNGPAVHTAVMVLLHESGHAVHGFEMYHLPYYQQRLPGMEFAEVASTAMEFLGARHLVEAGFYSETDAARGRIKHLEIALESWAFQAMADTFQHWVYEHPQRALEPAALDKMWAELQQRFLPGIDWNGIETPLRAGWQNLFHVFAVPFYMIEYAMAQLGAVQIWKRSLRDPEQSIRDYRQALALGATAPLPELYRASGASFAFDRAALTEAVELIERTLHDME